MKKSLKISVLTNLAQRLLYFIPTIDFLHISLIFDKENVFEFFHLTHPLSQINFWWKKTQN